MKARIAIIVVLAAVILLQISYLVKRVSSKDYSVPVVPTRGNPGAGAPGLAGAPGGEMGGPGRGPMGNAPPASGAPGTPPSGMPMPASGVPMAVPSGMPRPGAVPSGFPQPGMQPSGAPQLAAGNPPGSAQAPMGAVPSSVSISVDMLPYNELLSALVAMQKESGLALTAEQKAKLKPAIAGLEEIVKKSTGGPQQVAQVAVDTLRPDQIEFMVKHRTDPPPLDAIALGAGPPGPAAIGVAAVKVLEKHVAENDGKAASSGAKADPSQMMLGPEDLLGGILKLEGDKALAVTTAQAKTLLAPVDGMVKSSAAISEKTKEIVGALNDEQKKYVLKAHEGYMGNVGSGSAAPPEQMLAELQKQL